MADDEMVIADCERAFLNFDRRSSLYPRFQLGSHLPERDLTHRRNSLISERSGLPDGVTVAQQTLDLFVMVQIHVGQPIHLRPRFFTS